VRADKGSSSCRNVNNLHQNKTLYFDEFVQLIHISETLYYFTATASVANENYSGMQKAKQPKREKQKVLFPCFISFIR